MNARQTSLIAACVIASTAACGPADDSTRPGWSGSVDTLATGRVVVRSRPGTDTIATAVELFRLGALDEAGPELFGQIGGLEVGPGGSIYVLDGQASEIRFFGPDGDFQRAVGREGEGPGELQNPGGLALDAEGTLWVMNWGNGRYSGFDSESGELVREVRRQLSFGSFPWRGAFENGTRLVDVGLDRAGDIAILRLDTAFAPSDTLALPQPSDADRITFRRGSVMVASMMEPFAPQPVWAPRPMGGITVGEGEAYRVHRIAFSGDTTLTIELQRDPVRVSEAERDSALARFERRAQSLDGATPDRAANVRDFKPAHGSVFVDDQDRTWVGTVLPEGSDPAWDLFGPDGRHLGSVWTPELVGFLSPVVRGDRMAIATLARGFPEVVVYELVGPPQ